MNWNQSIYLGGPLVNNFLKSHDLGKEEKTLWTSWPWKIFQKKNKAIHQIQKQYLGDEAIKYTNTPHKLFSIWGSGCGSVGRAVASNSIDPQFASSHRQILFTIDCFKNFIEKTKIIKIDRDWPI